MIDLDQLDELQVYRLLTRLALELRAGLSDDQAELVENEADARKLVWAVGAKLNLAASQAPHNGPLEVTQAARRVLALLARDQDIQPRLAALVETLSAPARRPQSGHAPMVVKPQDVIALVLNAVAAWLQARIPITAEAEGYQVDLSRSETDPSLIEAIVRTVMRYGPVPGV
jgi:hypothetical protein